MRSGGVRAAAGDLAGAAGDWRRAEAVYAAHPPAGGQAAVLWACCRSSLAGLAGAAGSGVSDAEGAERAEAAMALLRLAARGGHRDLAPCQTEPGLDPLRSRADFRLLMMDAGLPDRPVRVGPMTDPVPTQDGPGPTVARTAEANVKDRLPIAEEAPW